MSTRDELIGRVEKLLIADLLADVRDLIEKATDEELETLAKELEAELFEPHRRAAEQAAKSEADKDKAGRSTEIKWG